jgi:Cu-Zn family superoxide dismutase
MEHSTYSSLGRRAATVASGIALAVLAACSPNEPDQPGFDEPGAFDNEQRPAGPTEQQPDRQREPGTDEIPGEETALGLNRPAASEGGGSAAGDAPQAARAELEPTEGNDVRGTVEFSRTADGKMSIVAEIRNLSPGPHGFHIHEKGDCSAPDASSAGGHFAPDGDPHGSPDAPPGEHHAGDLGNIVAEEDGTATYVIVDDELDFEGDYGILDRAVIVHARKDDFTTQPTGAAGPRLACGVIRKAGR